jgi:hypothetical protein
VRVRKIRCAKIRAGARCSVAGDLLGEERVVDVRRDVEQRIAQTQQNAGRNAHLIKRVVNRLRTGQGAGEETGETAGQRHAVVWDRKKKSFV